MDRLVVFLLLGFACNALGKYGEFIVSSPEMANKINTLNVGWEATVYKQFAGMDWVDAKQLLGSYGAWPKDSPPKGDCGSCWAFGASEVLSDRLLLSVTMQLTWYCLRSSLSTVTQ
ncbi:hypothetical protein OS493_018172 [Desmophyllum pertusum]|uniref:Peptidase C1A papain C-terminal domain-containing protein n=1 Tax=Desmophyllum pertusum TaxID=174260 RepID=A0A9W9YPU7_9CNID|nr:hypothetical protein OS493_018172 [Desmophyllum pertusum]